MRCLVPLAFLLAALPASARAQDDNGQVICVSSAHLWRGSSEDVRRIRTIAVPDSFRRIFEGGGCSRWSLVKEMLIDWHLAFGDEASVTAALAYLEADYTRNLPAPAALSGLLAAARGAAARDLAAAAALRAATPPDQAGSDRLLSRSRPVRRLGELMLARQNFLFLAQNYLRAADFHQSRALHGKALTYAAAALAGSTVLPPEESQGRPNELPDLEMHLALVQAGFTRSPADIAAAQAVLDRHYDPTLLAGAARAEDGDPCELGDRPDPEGLQAACRDESDFRGRLTDYWIAQARLDLLKAADPDHFDFRTARPAPNGSFYVPRGEGGTVAADAWPRPQAFDYAIRLLARQRPDMAPEQARRYDHIDDAEVLLHLLRADLFARRAAAPPVPDPDSQAAWRARELRDAALFDLSEGLRIAGPAEHAGRFRQLATRYLEIAAIPSSERIAADPVQEREAVFLRATLDSLDRIVAARP
jgi:hypothetical protein